VAEGYDLVIRAARAIVGGEESSCCIGVTAGRIAEVGAYSAPAVGASALDLGDDVVLLPGLVDSHVHVCEPGHTDWEGFAAATRAAAAIPEATGRKYADYLASRPRGLENLAIAEVIEAARVTGGHAHVVHLSSSDALPMIATAQNEGVRVSAETCPHYLTLAAEEIADGATAAKCSPPVREAANRELLWAGLRDGIVDLVVSDHSPCTADMKELASGDFGRAWGGISSLQLGLPLVWTEASRREVSLAQVATWMAARPAELAGLHRKGQIRAGFDADFCVFAPDAPVTVDPARLHHRNPVTPYAGWDLRGEVRATLLGGEPVDPARPRGRFLAWGEAAR